MHPSGEKEKEELHGWLGLSLGLRGCAQVAVARKRNSKLTPRRVRVRGQNIIQSSSLMVHSHRPVF